MIPLALLFLLQSTPMPSSSAVAVCAHERNDPDARVDAPRVRFGAGPWYAIGAYPQLSGSLAGFSLHAGVQVKDRFGFYLLGQLGTSLVASPFSGAALAEFSLLEWISVAAGVGVAGVSVSPTTSVWGPSGITGTSRPGYVALALGAPARLTFNLGFKRFDSGYRTSFFIALDGFAGARVLVEGGDDQRLDRNAQAAVFSGGVSLGFELR